MRIEPRFQLTVFAPKHVDPTETTPLTPRAGSAHAEPFIVSTFAGDVGSRPYLGWPRGLEASIDPLTKKRTVARLTIPVHDQRVGTGNFERWVTAFLGDTAGANQLAGCRVEVKSWDGAAYQPWYTGRITGDRLNGALKLDLTVDDRSADLDAPVFVGRLHAAVAGYAHRAQLLPIGLLKPYGPFPVTTPVRARVDLHSNGGFGAEVDHSDADQQRTLMTRALTDLANESRSDGYRKLRGEVTPDGGYPSGQATYTEWLADAVTYADDHRTKRLFFTPKPGVAGVPTLPPIGTQISAVIHAADDAASAIAPVLVDDIHPVTFLRDLAAGYYGWLRADGTPAWSLPVAASLAALEADPSFPPFRATFDGASTFVKVLEQVCRQCNLGYDLDATGALDMFDLRRTAAAPISGTLTDDDRVLEAGVPQWGHEKKGALPIARVAYYLERRVEDRELGRFSTRDNPTVPDVPATRIATKKLDAVVLRDADAVERFEKPKEEAIDAVGFRFRGDAEELHQGRPRDAVLRAHAATLVRDLQAPLSRGPATLAVVCRASSAAAASVRQGQRWILDFDAVPDPATNRRGGPRLALCLSRAPEGLSIRLTFLDLGGSTVAVAPVLAAPTKTAGDTARSLDVGVTRNVAGNPVRLDVAITDTTVAVRPAETDAAWHQGAIATADGAARIGLLPARARVWLRGRSEPQAGDGLQIPSGWVFPAGAGYVDLDAFTAPAGLAVVTPSATATVASWTAGDAARDVEVLLVAGGVPAAWLDAHRIARLEPGTTTFPLGELAALTAGAQYTVGVRHRDALGGTSAVTAATFVVGATPTLPLPVHPTGYSGRTYGLAVEATAFPSTVEFREAVETAGGSGVYGAPVTVAAPAAVAGDWTRCERTAPKDGKRRQLSARQTAPSALPSDWTAPIVVTPWTSAALPPFASSARAPIAQLVETGSDATHVTFGLGADVPVQDWQLVSWRDRIDAVPAWPSGWTATALPTAQAQAREAKVTRHVLFRVRDAAGRISEPVRGIVPSRFDFFTDAGAPRRDQPWSDGDYAVAASTSTGKKIRPDVADDRGALINAMFRYGVDGVAGVLEDSIRGFAHPSYLDGLRRPVLIYSPAAGAPRSGDEVDDAYRRALNAIRNYTGGLTAGANDDRGAALNQHFRYGVDGAAGVMEDATRGFAHPSFLDASRRPVQIYSPALGGGRSGDELNDSHRRAIGAIADTYDGKLLSGASDSRGAMLNAMFRYGVDGAVGVMEDSLRKFTHPDFLDASRRPVQLARSDASVATADFLAGNVGTAPGNLVKNGGAQSSQLGQASSVGGLWTYDAGEAFVASSTVARSGDRSWRCTHAAAAYSVSHQDLLLVYAGQVVRISCAVYPSGFAGSGTGRSGVMAAIVGNEVDGTFTVLGKTSDLPTYPTRYAAATISNAAGDIGWIPLTIIARVNVTGTLRLYKVHGYEAAVAGTVYIDDIVVERLDDATAIGGWRAKDALDDNARLTGPTRLPQSVVGNRLSMQGSNPLSSTFSGGFATISIAAHTLYLGGGSVSYNGGSITTLAAGTKYYVYADDPTYAGGTVTYLASTNAHDILGAAGRYFVGYITSATSSGGTTGTPGGGPPIEPT